MSLVQFTMFHIGGPSTGSSSFSSLVGIGSSMLLDGLEAVTIFMNVPRDTGLKNLSFSLILDPGSSVQTTEHWRNMQIQRGVHNLISNDHDLFMEEVHEFITAEVESHPLLGNDAFS